MVGNGRFLWDWKKSHSQCIWMSARPIHVVLFDVCWVTLEGVCCRCEEIVRKERVFEDDIFIENTRLGGGSKRRTKFTHGRSSKLVTWFYWPMVSPRLNMCASAIFVVGTSGIPPKLNYRSVKSYKVLSMDQIELFVNRVQTNDILNC